MQELKEHFFPRIKETFYSGKLPNGLQVYLIPKTDFNEYSCYVMTRFGALDTSVKGGEGTHKEYPLGLAHFLEHKLFELEDGKDLFKELSNQGVDSNAFTGFDKTCYFFSTTDKGQFGENIRLFLDSLLSTSFTEESIEREKKIIEQEIAMYQDDPDFRLYQGILSNLFPATALAEDIAGTKDSIQKITLTDLQENHQFFYQPTNMTLLLVGDFDAPSMFEILKEFHEDDSKTDKIQKLNSEVEYFPVVKTKSIYMDVAQSKLAIGYRGQKFKNSLLLKQKIALKLFFAMVLGWTSKTYQNLYESGQIDDSFDIEIEIQNQFQYLILSLDTAEPIAMSNRIRQYLKNLKNTSDLSATHLQTVKSELYGDFIRSLDDVDYLASQFVSYLGDKESYFDFPDILADLTLKDVVKIGKEFLQTADVADYIISPK